VPRIAWRQIIWFLWHVFKLFYLYCLIKHIFCYNFSCLRYRLVIPEIMRHKQRSHFIDYSSSVELTPSS
jgi:hypothetical protein